MIRAVGGIGAGRSARAFADYGVGCEQLNFDLLPRSFFGVSFCAVSFGAALCCVGLKVFGLSFSGSNAAVLGMGEDWGGLALCVAGLVTIGGASCTFWWLIRAVVVGSVVDSL